jgi:UPF0755 protein
MPNVQVANEKTYLLFLPKNNTFETLKDSLYHHDLIINKGHFEWATRQKKMPKNIKSGCYKIVSGMNNNELINMLRSGKQTPINLTFNNIRTKEQFAGRMAERLEFDSLSLIKLLNNRFFLDSLQKNPETVISLFIPNTYSIYWNIDPRKFVLRMKKEYDTFWNEMRQEKAQQMGLTVDQVITLASIVQEESNKNDEKSRIAGVYMNRLAINMQLQADPTLKFACGDFTLRRVLNVHKETESPYNTYKHTGLPPGPICMPDIATINAVLNYEHHGYYYFCAKDDMSGYHVFETTLTQHNINAQKYSNALNRLNIYR